MHSTLRQTAPASPCADNLSYTLGLPDPAYCAPLARHTVRRLLRQHRLGELVDLGELAVAELLAGAHFYVPRLPVILSVRHRHDVLRLTLFDQHPDPVRCRPIRRAQLTILAAVAAVCGGAVGLSEADPPLRGTRVWVTLPRSGAVAYERT